MKNIIIALIIVFTPFCTYANSVMERYHNGEEQLPVLDVWEGVKSEPAKAKPVQTKSKKSHVTLKPDSPKVVQPSYVPQKNNNHIVVASSQADAEHQRMLDQLANQIHQENQEIIANEERKKKFLKTPAGRLLRDLNRGSFSTTWYAEIDRKFVRSIKLSHNPKVTKHKNILRVPKVVVLENFVIIELEWKYNNSSPRLMGLDFGTIYAMDSSNNMIYPKLVVDAKGKKCEQYIEVGGKHGYIKSYHIYHPDDLNAFLNGSLRMGQKSTLLFKYSIR